MRTRRIYLRNLSGKETVKFSKFHEKFLLENERHRGVFLTNPVLKVHPVYGVFFEDTGEDGYSDVLFSSTDYRRLHTGERP